jgi:inosine-uridine nucleoside N-ribohydrolase
MYPHLVNLIKKMFILGGNDKGVGNCTRHAEFNFYADPEAAFIVFNDSTCEINVFTWESCVLASKDLPFDEFRINELSKFKSPFTSFLDPVEIVAYENFKPKNWMPCDCFIAVCFILPHAIKKSEFHHVSIELGGNFTRGMMVIDHIRTEKPNATIITEIDTEMFKNYIKWICGDKIADFMLKN